MEVHSLVLLLLLSGNLKNHPRYFSSQQCCSLNMSEGYIWWYYIFYQLFRSIQPWWDQYLDLGLSLGLKNVYRKLKRVKETRIIIRRTFRSRRTTFKNLTSNFHRVFFDVLEVHVVLFFSTRWKRMQPCT